MEMALERAEERAAHLKLQSPGPESGTAPPAEAEPSSLQAVVHDGALINAVAAELSLHLAHEREATGTMAAELTATVARERLAAEGAEQSPSQSVHECVRTFISVRTFIRAHMHACIHGHGDRCEAGARRSACRAGGHGAGVCRKGARLWWLEDTPPKIPQRRPEDSPKMPERCPEYSRKMPWRCPERPRRCAEDAPKMHLKMPRR